MGSLLFAREISCSRPANHNKTVHLASLSFESEPGSLHYLLDPENCANRLFLRILGLLEKPDSGEVYLHDLPTAPLPGNEVAELRSRHFGYVFPEPFLLPSLGIFENVAMPLFKISDVNIEDARQRTSASLNFVGLGDCQEPLAGDLSLFDQHRVSFARALVNHPEILILENLDEIMSEAELIEFIRLVRAASVRFGVSAIFSGADRRFGALMDNVLEISSAD